MAGSPDNRSPLQRLIGAIIAFLEALLGANHQRDDPGSKPTSDRAKSTGKDDSLPPYVLIPAFMTEAESRFDQKLSALVDECGLRLHRKVRLADILQVPPGTERWQYWFNRISAKHADFVLCAGQRPVGVIELDDSSHRSKRRSNRDEFVDRAYAAAGLPVLHVPVSPTYDSEELLAFIERSVSAAT